LVEGANNGDYEIAFRLKRPQPAFLALLASGFSPIYPCHVPAREMRSRPIGTGPFKFVEFKPNEHIKVTRNPDYWKPARPYLDGIEYTIIKNASTAILAFAPGKVDMTFAYSVTHPLLSDVSGCVFAKAAGDAIDKEIPPAATATKNALGALLSETKDRLKRLNEENNALGWVGWRGSCEEEIYELLLLAHDIAITAANADLAFSRLKVKATALNKVAPTCQ